MVEVRREDLAWAAGFFDGEGCTHVSRAGSRSPRTRVRMTISQNHREPLDKFQRILGMGSVYGPYAAPGRTNEAYRYDLGGAAKVQAAVAMLWAFLGTEKRNQAKEGLAKAHFERPMLNRTKCNRGHDYEGNRTEYGQCRACMREADRRRRAA